MSEAIPTRAMNTQPDGHPNGSVCPAVIADLLSYSGVNPLDWVDDWVDLLVLIATAEGARAAFGFPAENQNDREPLTAVSTGATIRIVGQEAESVERN